jgi:DNA transformation protein
MRHVSDRLIAQLRNLDRDIGDRLASVGVFTERELRRIGASVAWRRLAAQDPAGTRLELLYALEGALRGLRWTRLPETVRVELHHRTLH